MEKISRSIFLCVNKENLVKAIKYFQEFSWKKADGAKKDGLLFVFCAAKTPIRLFQGKGEYGEGIIDDDVEKPFIGLQLPLLLDAITSTKEKDIMANNIFDALESGSECPQDFYAVSNFFLLSKKLNPVLWEVHVSRKSFLARLCKALDEGKQRQFKNKKTKKQNIKG